MLQNYANCFRLIESPPDWVCVSISVEVHYVTSLMRDRPKG
jgi:hypothetical protein